MKKNVFTSSASSLTVLIERFPNVILILHSWDIAWANNRMSWSYLGVKRVPLKFIIALELPGVSLVHGQSVFSSLKYLSFVHLYNA